MGLEPGDALQGTSFCREAPPFLDIGCGVEAKSITVTLSKNYAVLVYVLREID